MLSIFIFYRLLHYTVDGSFATDLKKVKHVLPFYFYKMWRTKIIVYPSTTQEEVMRALPVGFKGHVTIEEQDEKDKRYGCQVCMIHHSNCLNPKKVYENLGIELHGSLLLPLFIFEKK
jgi:hypothetical protein